MYRPFIIAAVIATIPVSQKFIDKDVFAVSSGGPSGNSYDIENLCRIKPLKDSFWVKQKNTTASWTDSWLSLAKENIRKAEYNFTWEDKRNAYCTPNRNNQLRFFYNESGFSVEPQLSGNGIIDPRDINSIIKKQKTKKTGWKIRFDIDKKLLGKGSWKVRENKAEYITGPITVQYINNDEGMRQNFIVNSPVPGQDQLEIPFSISTGLTTILQPGKLLFFHKKKNVLNYEDLKVWDANGKTLTAVFKKIAKGKYGISVDAKDAVYPITIDPLSTTPAIMLESSLASANFGCSVASAGDVNGDGYSDVIVGSYSYNNGQTSEGAFFIFHGSAAGLSATPAVTAESNQASALMGYAVSTAGDVNGDGYSDIIVGVPNYDAGQTDEGRAYIYHGSAAGINTTPAATVESNQASAFLGYSVASAGDVNRDGYSDVIVGAYSYDNGQTDEGAIFIYHGSATGINTTPAATVESNQASGFLGYSVASAGDVNGDGYSDVIAGAHLYDNGESNEGAAFVYHGSATGINTTPAVTLEGNQVSAVMGYAVSSAGDVNGDGYSDVLVSAYQYDNGEADEGAAFIFHGSATGINATPAALLECNQAGAYYGWYVNCAGDINGDGYADVVVGAYSYANGQSSEGAAFVYQGSVSGINTTAVAIMEGNQATARMGCSVASAGDVNGDGYSDLVVGARLYDNDQTNEGAAFVYHGSAAGLSAAPTNSRDDSNQANAHFGFSVAGAGDVNGDGYSDVIIGAAFFDDGANADEGRAFVYHGSATGLSATPNSTPDDADQPGASFAVSVASAGDVNNDGYSDVIIGAYTYDEAQIDEGRIYVYHGSASGLGASPAAIRDDAGQFAALFGHAVASAGDVNGDGYADVIVGAFSYDDGAADEGAAFVYHGSATGIAATPSRILTDGNQVSAHFGYSVAGAGDVNGDGYSDVIIGARAYDVGANADEGRAFVYHGSATGLSATPNSTPNDAAQANAQFGFSVAGAGDVNGDGYSDVVIGAYLYNDGANTDEGRAYLYYGSATGIGPVPSVVLHDANQPGASFGISVAGAGDVNGDGYSDVIIGAAYYTDGVSTNEGRAFLYHGSATGISTINSEPDDANQALAYFGNCVTSAGDINGDGYSDIIIGAYFYDDGPNTNEGRAYVYSGNEFSTNKRNNLRLYNTDLVTPINNSNKLSANFGAGLFARSFMGRDYGKMVWETRLNYTPYSGAPITNSVSFTGQQASYADMGIAGFEFKRVIAKIAGAGNMTRLRARVKYYPVKAITGQIYGPWRYVSAIIDGNSKMGVLPLELISFNAAWQQKGKTAQLTFITDNENGICCFDIEKSNDGFNYTSIASIAARNTAGRQTYTYIDNNATAKQQYYRLKIKGMQGQTEYSNIQQLQYNKTADIFVFPNPTADVLRLMVGSSYNRVNVQVLNSSGQRVMQMNNVAAVNNMISIPVQQLPAGNYWIRLQSGSEEQLLQFVKQ